MASRRVSGHRCSPTIYKAVHTRPTPVPSVCYVHWAYHYTINSFLNSCVSILVVWLRPSSFGHNWRKIPVSQRSLTIRPGLGYWQFAGRTKLNDPYVLSRTILGSKCQTNCSRRVADQMICDRNAKFRREYNTRTRIRKERQFKRVFQEIFYSDSRSFASKILQLINYKIIIYNL